MSVDNVEKLIKDHKVEFIDLRFADMRGIQHHVTFPASIVETVAVRGRQDVRRLARSPAGRASTSPTWCCCPIPTTAFLDPFTADPTLVLTCDILDPATMQAYSRDPRGIAKRAEAFLKSSGIAEQAFFGPEPEFFIFDSVRYANDMGHTFFKIDSEEAAWNSGDEYEGGNTGYRPGVKGGYFPVAPLDSLHDIRAEMCKTLEAVGIEVEVHHHEVANAGQCEIGTKFNTLVQEGRRAADDEVHHQERRPPQRQDRDLHAQAASSATTAAACTCTSRWPRAATTCSAATATAACRRLALWYIGGIFKHARAINAFANSATNSYKRLVPGFEAPVMLAYSARNRSASCRIPYVSNPKARRIEMRFPDPMQSGYLTFTALMMAGLDGIKNQIDPGAPSDKDLYDLPPEEEKNIPQVCSSLDQALEALDKDREFLKAGGVMTDDFIDGYIALKMQEVTAFRAATHPLEYQLYYGI